MVIKISFFSLSILRMFGNILINICISLLLYPPLFELSIIGPLKLDSFIFNINYLFYFVYLSLKKVKCATNDILYIIGNICGFFLWGNICENELARSIDFSNHSLKWEYMHYNLVYWGRSCQVWIYIIEYQLS